MQHYILYIYLCKIVMIIMILIITEIYNIFAYLRYKSGGGVKVRNMQKKTCCDTFLLNKRFPLWQMDDEFFPLAGKQKEVASSSVLHAGYQDSHPFITFCWILNTPLSWDHLRHLSNLSDRDCASKCINFLVEQKWKTLLWMVRWRQSNN